MSHPSGGVHPEISSLVRHKDEMWSQLQAGNYTAALETMLVILYDIENKDVPQDLVNKVNREITVLERFESNAQHQDRLKKSRPRYWKMAHAVQQVLWAKDYLVNKRYGPIVGEDEVKFD